MILYKYLPSTRIACIQKRLIRFTQYGDFSDPFELSPNIDKLAEDDEIREIVDRDFVKIVEEEYHNNQLISSLICKDIFVNFALTQKESVKKAIVSIEPHVVKLLPDLIQKSVNSLLGALSLSEVSDHELMWSHYAGEHKGYVLGFDSTHPFFNQKKSDSDELRHLRKIEYRAKRPVINLMHTDGSELFFIKSSKWSYEAEWRMLLPLSDAKEVVNKNPYPIHLFKFPADAINRIILGARFSEEDEKVIHHLFNQKEFSHVELYRAHLESSSYGICIEKIQPHSLG